MPAKDTDHASLGTSIVKPYTNSIRGAPVKDCDRRTGVDQSAQRPVSRVAIFQAHIHSWPEDRRVAFLPVRKETIHAVQASPDDLPQDVDAP